MGTCSLYFLFGPCLWSEWFCRALLCDVITDLKQRGASRSRAETSKIESQINLLINRLSQVFFFFLKMFIYSSFIPYIPTMASLSSIPLKAMENWIAKTISIVCKVSRGISVIDFKFNSTVLRGHNWYNPSLLIVFFKVVSPSLYDRFHPWVHWFCSLISTVDCWGSKCFVISSEIEKTFASLLTVMLSGANRYWGHNPGQGQVVFSSRKAPDKIYWLRSGCRSPQEMAPKVKSIALCRWWFTDGAVFAAVDTGERKPGLLNPCKAPVTAGETLLVNLLPRHWQGRGWTFVPVYWLSQWSDCLILLLQLRPSRELQSSLQSYYTICLPSWVCPHLTSPSLPVLSLIALPLQPCE